MQQLRLIGLILFITTVFLGMAAVATQTAEIRLFDARHTQEPPFDEGNGPNGQPHKDDFKPQFISIPIIWPLTLAGGLGLVLWFGTAPREPANTKARRRRRRRL